MQVSNLWFGAMSFGGNADEEASKTMFRRCREAGINFKVYNLFGNSKHN